MGTTLRQIVEEIGGGPPDGHDQGRADRRPLRRLHPGRCTSIRPSITSRSTRVGSIMGSGGMIVMDQDTNMVDVARFFMEFCMDESCGKCIPCRAGTVQMHRLLDPDRRRAMAAAMTWPSSRNSATWSSTRACAGWANRPRTRCSARLRYFRHEYEALLKDPARRHPAPRDSRSIIRPDPGRPGRLPPQQGG